MYFEEDKELLLLHARELDRLNDIKNALTLSIWKEKARERARKLTRADLREKDHNPPSIRQSDDTYTSRKIRNYPRVGT